MGAYSSRRDADHRTQCGSGVGSSPRSLALQALRWEALMRKSFYLAAAAVLLMATSNAQAGGGFNFEIGGQKIHIDAPKNCSSLNCLSVSNNGSPINLKNMNLKGRNSNDDDDVATNSPP